MIRPTLLAVLAAALLLAQTRPVLTESITAASLRGRVSFLASDSLEGRDTPSRGLDIAAEYIASEFRRAGLESPSGNDYSQNADYLQISEASDSPQFSISGAGEPIRSIAPSRMLVTGSRAARLLNDPVFKWAPGERIDAPLTGKILILRAPADPATIAKLALSRPDAVVEITRKPIGVKSRTPQLIPVEKDPTSTPLVVHVPENEIEAAFDRLPVGLTNARASVQVAEPAVKPVRLRNLVGILRGSDPKLRDEYVLISAHYDHLGIANSGEKDRIFNGANDDASGVASVLELAHAFAQSHSHPARTIVFLCFFGEERGLFGSTWYVKHPLFPLARTVAELNLEQVGEPGNGEGLPAGSLGVTGYKFTDLPRTLAPSFESAGVSLRDVPTNVEYFDRSDNLPFARAGVPAVTFAAAFSFPDYHRVSDEWPRLNYDNLANLNRGIAVALLALANGAQLPKWNEENKKTQEYVKAWRTLHP